MTFIQTIPLEEATGLLKQVYDKELADNGVVDNGVRAFGLRPSAHIA